MKPRPAAVIIGSVIALIMAATFYSWRFSYFWLDDFNNLFLVQQQSLVHMLWYNVDPVADFFRPFGMLVYLFGFRANFTDIYWNFGTIFELLAFLLMFLALLIYTGRLKPRQLVLVALFVSTRHQIEGDGSHSSCSFSPL